MNLATSMVKNQSLRLDSLCDEYGFEMTQQEKMQFIARFSGAGTPDDLQTALSTDITEIVLPKGVVPQMIAAGDADYLDDDDEVFDGEEEIDHDSLDLESVFSTTNGFALNKSVNHESQEIAYSVTNARGEVVITIPSTAAIEPKAAFSQILEAMDIDRVTRVHNAVVEEISNLQLNGGGGETAVLPLGTINAKMAVKKQAIELSHLLASKGVDVSLDEKCSILSSLHGTNASVFQHALGINLREQFENTNIEALRSATSDSPLAQKHLMFSSGGALIVTYDQLGSPEVVRFNNMVGMEVARLCLADFENLDEILESTSQAFRNENIAAASRLQDAHIEMVESTIESLDTTENDQDHDFGDDTGRVLGDLMSRVNPPRLAHNEGEKIPTSIDPELSPPSRSIEASDSSHSDPETPQEPSADETSVEGSEIVQATSSDGSQNAPPPEQEADQNTNPEPTRRKRGPRDLGF